VVTEGPQDRDTSGVEEIRLYSVEGGIRERKEALHVKKEAAIGKRGEEGPPRQDEEELRTRAWLLFSRSRPKMEEPSKTKQRRQHDPREGTCEVGRCGVPEVE